MLKVRSRNLVLTSAPRISCICSKEMFSSCPVVALVAGVKIGSGSLSDSRSPAGNLMPETAPLALYSFQAEPEMYPRATHSTGNISARTTSMDLPRN